MKVPAFIIQKTTIKTEKMWQFYLSVALWAVVYTTMNVSIVIFLAEQFGSYFLAGLALATGNFFSMFLIFRLIIYKKFLQLVLFFWLRLLVYPVRFYYLFIFCFLLIQQ